LIDTATAPASAVWRQAAAAGDPEPPPDEQAPTRRAAPKISGANWRRDMRASNERDPFGTGYGVAMAVVSPGYRGEMTRDVDADTMWRLLMHEARVHAIPGRELRDMGDAILLHDPVDPELFWNRLEGLRWPVGSEAFDRRLTEMLVLFASLGRRPHIWAAPVHDSPPDLVDRLVANGFRDVGAGEVMVLADGATSTGAEPLSLPSDVTVERLAGMTGEAAESGARDVVGVLLDAFEVEPGRRAGIEAETVTSLGHPWLTHYLLRVGGLPAAAARRATFDGASYLSSIGTAGWARGRGFGGLVTRVAAADGAVAGEWTYLGVFSENTQAIAVYQRVGFERVGMSCPDLVLL
jgi:hypothetical protein